MVYDNETINRYAKEFRPVPFLKTLQHLNYDQEFDVKSIIAQAEKCMEDINGGKLKPFKPMMVIWVPEQRILHLDDDSEIDHPVTNPWPAAWAVVRPVMGSTPKAIMISPTGPAPVPLICDTLQQQVASSLRYRELPCR